MKILFVCNEYPPYKHGGIGVFVKNLAEKLVTKGFGCVVVGIYSNIPKSIREVVNDVVIYREKSNVLLSSIFLRNIVNSISNKIQLSKLIEKVIIQEGITIVESYDWTGPLFYKPSKYLIIRLHGSNSANAEYQQKNKSKWLFFWEKRNIKVADLVVSVSNHLLKISENTFGKLPNSKVIYNSVDTNIFYYKEWCKKQKLLLFVGKFHKWKGVFELFEILKYLLKYDNEYKFLFVGNHSFENAQELLSIIDIENQNQVSFKEAIPQKELCEIYNMASIMLMPTKAEAFGLTIIEAMACNCVVAMNNKATASELINDGEDGFLFELEHPKKAAKRIHSFLSDKSKLEEMGLNSMEKVKTRFSNDVLLGENIELYKSCFKNNET